MFVQVEDIDDQKRFVLGVVVDTVFDEAVVFVLIGVECC